MRRQNSPNMRTARLLAFACVAAVALFSSWFVAAHAHHDCTGHNCPTCALVRRWSDVGQALGAGLIILASVSLDIEGIALYTLFWRNSPHNGSPTLVQLKVRLNS